MIIGKNRKDEDEEECDDVEDGDNGDDVEDDDNGDDVEDSDNEDDVEDGEAERTRLISLFNELPSKDKQDAFLASCIAIKSIQRRRAREESQNPMPNESSYDYSVYVTRNETAVKVTICVKALCSIFGVTERRIRTVRDPLKSTGFHPRIREEDIKIILINSALNKGRRYVTISSLLKEGSPTTVATKADAYICPTP
ncbi:hypothetical protein RRG08_023186 [Elysia crispata]|uniref:Uncharacterized protein n=1 Tax=Elysia crispata TaxID=231223 RepID=A0AAE0ZPT5_9GAST|nr:hypothetical protein RRG08_023186 [Elysia crispata]